MAGVSSLVATMVQVRVAKEARKKKERKKVRKIECKCTAFVLTVLILLVSLLWFAHRSCRCCYCFRYFIDIVPILCTVRWWAANGHAITAKHQWHAWPAQRGDKVSAMTAIAVDKTFTKVLAGDAGGNAYFLRAMRI